MRLPLLVLAVSACADTGASVRLALSNETQAVQRTSVLADGTALHLKLIAVYLAQDVDPVTQANVGMTSMIWANPQCAGDLAGCNVDGLAEPAGGPRVTDYFDLARPSAEINAELHAQATEIDAGSYRYARVELCKGAGNDQLPTVPTLRWRGPGMTEEQAFASGDCARTSLPFDPPLVLAAGDSVTVELGYDLARAIVVGTPTTSGCSTSIEGDPRCFRACVDTGPAARTCMDFPEFAPTAVLQPAPQ